MDTTKIIVRIEQLLDLGLKVRATGKRIGVNNVRKFLVFTFR